MGQRYLVDTSAVIKYLNDDFPSEGTLFMDNEIADEQMISFISEIELQSWTPANADDMEVYLDFIKDATILSIDASIIKQTIEIRKNQKLKIPDAIIAATAIVNDFTLITDNDKDFNRVLLLKYINPNTLK
jgi:predicted nucleic acid-binding protein